MVTISGSAKQLAKIKGFFEHHDCKGFDCLAAEMADCVTDNRCPYHVDNILFQVMDVRDDELK